MDTYWLHIEMLIKYFKRKDLFKILKNLDVLFHAHVDLLLSEYDTLDWGAWESKVKHGVPQELQEHLRLYGAKADFPELEAAVKAAMASFYEDARAVCRSKGIAYPDSIPQQIMTYFHRRLSQDEWL
ncbi:hypothetical protein D3C73_1275330 [compost metagenome]